jgi:hypothetical protein
MFSPTRWTTPYAVDALESGRVQRGCAGERASVID